jgi:DNA-binding transcriptional MerR regulator
MERLWLKIGEAAKRLGVTPKELRYWEHIIPEIEPRRSKGNLRYYHVDELGRLAQIRQWLQEGLTVADCRELMLTGQLARPLDLGLGTAPPVLPLKKHKKKPVQASRGPAMTQVADALKKLVDHLSGPPAPLGS